MVSDSDLLLSGPLSGIGTQKQGILYGLLAALTSQNIAKRPDTDTSPVFSSSEDSSLCRRILEVDPAIRAAAIIQGDEVCAFADSAKSTNALSQSQFREKIGFWVRIVTEISRQTEPLFGKTESISFVHEKLKLVTFPLSAHRSIGLSMERSADVNYLIGKVMSRIGTAL